MGALQIYKKSIGREKYAALPAGWVKEGDTSLSFTPYTESEAIIINMFMEYSK